MIDGDKIISQLDAASVRSDLVPVVFGAPQDLRQSLSESASRILSENPKHAEAAFIRCWLTLTGASATVESVGQATEAFAASGNQPQTQTFAKIVLTVGRSLERSLIEAAVSAWLQEKPDAPEVYAALLTLDKLWEDGDSFIRHMAQARASVTKPFHCPAASIHTKAALLQQQRALITVGEAAAKYGQPRNRQYFA